MVFQKGPFARAEFCCGQGFFNKLGNESKGGFGAGKPPFWERPTFVLWTAAQSDPSAAEEALAADDDFKGWKNKYDRSRRTVTRTGMHPCS